MFPWFPKCITLLFPLRFIYPFSISAAPSKISTFEKVCFIILNVWNMFEERNLDLAVHENLHENLTETNLKILLPGNIYSEEQYMIKTRK